MRSPCPTSRHRLPGRRHTGGAGAAGTKTPGASDGTASPLAAHGGRVDHPGRRVGCARHRGDGPGAVGTPDVALVNDGRHVGLVEVDDAPGYFRIARTGRMQLVRSLTRVTRPDGAMHLAVRFWCANMATDRAGELPAVMPPHAIECAGCEQIRYRAWR